MNNPLFVDSPRIQRIPSKTVREGNTLTFHCTADGNPQPADTDYVWTHERGRTKRTQNITLTGADNNDTGEYTCTVSVDSKGGYGELTGSTKTRLTVQCK